MARRENGVRCLRQPTRMRPGRYHLRATVTDPTTGQRKEKTRIAEFRNDRDAAIARDELVGELQAELRREGFGRMTLAEYGDRWFERTAERCRWKHSSRLSYRVHLDRIAAELGSVFVDQLSVVRAQDFIDREAKRYSPVVARLRLGAFRRLLKSATKELDLPKDVGALVDAPPRARRSGKKGLNALSGDQLRKLWDVMKATEPEWFPLFALIASTGLRFSEASAVQWSDFTERDGLVTLEIQRAQYRRVVGPPKTVESARSLPILPDTWAVLKEHRASLLKAQNRGLAAGWVFPTSAGTLLTSGALNKPLKRAVKTAKLDLQLSTHGLRRSVNTLALQVAPGELVRKILGHTTEAMTEHYSAPDMAAKRAVMLKVAELYRPGE